MEQSQGAAPAPSAQTDKPDLEAAPPEQSESEKLKA